MKYRAKVTACADELKCWYPNFLYVKDSKDTWAEVDSERTAELLEKLNDMVEKLHKGL